MAPRLLFLIVLTTGLAMATLVVTAPYLLGDATQAHDLLLLFARDMTVRRTAFFCSVGLIATGFIFFRPTAVKKQEKPASVNMTGA